MITGYRVKNLPPFKDGTDIFMEYPLNTFVYVLRDIKNPETCCILDINQLEYHLDLENIYNYDY